MSHPAACLPNPLRQAAAWAPFRRESKALLPYGRGSDLSHDRKGVVPLTFDGARGHFYLFGRGSAWFARQVEHDSWRRDRRVVQIK